MKRGRPNKLEQFAKDMQFAGAAAWLARNPVWKVTETPDGDTGNVLVTAIAHVDGQDWRLGFLRTPQTTDGDYAKLRNALDMSMAQLLALTPAERFLRCGDAGQFA